jgi:glycosyltransferase involved in cell wall biosynthesis
MMPTVSVLVTVYNREAYIAHCLESVLASTWQDFEVIVVDDNSADASAAIVEGYASRDSRLRLYRNPENLGDYGNRQRAARLASGRYLKYVDSDDLIYRHGLAIMVEAMDAYSEAALGLCYSRPEEIEPYPWKLTPEQAWRREFLGAGCMGCGPTGAIIRRERFFEVGGFRNWGVLNDTDLWYRLSARWPLLLMPPGLTWWRRHARQESTIDDASTAYLERGFQLSLETLGAPDCPLSTAERDAAVARCRQHHARRLISLAVRKKRPRLAWRLLSSSKLGALGLMRGLKPYR